MFVDVCLICPTSLLSVKIWSIFVLQINCSSPHLLVSTESSISLLRHLPPSQLAKNSKGSADSSPHFTVAMTDHCQKVSLFNTSPAQVPKGHPLFPFPEQKRMARHCPEMSPPPPSVDAQPPDPCGVLSFEAFDALPPALGPGTRSQCPPAGCRDCQPSGASAWGGWRSQAFFSPGVLDSYINWPMLPSGSLLDP